MLRSVTVTDGELVLDDLGDGPPVLLLHSGGADRRVWDAQLDTFAASYRVLRLDLRGHGDSSTPVGPFAHHDDVAEVLDQLGLDRVAVVGVSLGAATAVDLALEHRGRIEQLVAVGAGTSTAEFHDPWAFDVQARLAEAAAAGDPQRWIEEDMAFFDGPYRSPGDIDPDLRGRFRRMLEKTVMTHVVTAGPPELRVVVDAAARLPELTMPVLGVVGELDARDHHRMVRDLVTGVADGRLVTMADAAHHPMMETPETFNDVVLAFLRGEVEQPGSSGRNRPGQ